MRFRKESSTVVPIFTLVRILSKSSLFRFISTIAAFLVVAIGLSLLRAAESLAEEAALWKINLSRSIELMLTTSVNVSKSCPSESASENDSSRGLV